MSLPDSVTLPLGSSAVPRRASYLIVLATVATWLLIPSLALWLLTPLLLVGALLLGVAHGACDQFVMPATHPALSQSQLRYWACFLVGYLGLAALVGLLWWWQPAATVGLFFGLTAWHWGSADAPILAAHPRYWIAHSLLRGGLLFAVPLLYWADETREIINGLLSLGGASPVSATAIFQLSLVLGTLVAGGHLLLWASYFRYGHHATARMDMLEAGLLIALLVVLPPLLSAGVYFVFWHSLHHVLRMNQLMGRHLLSRRLLLGPELGFFLRRSAPLLALSLTGLAILYGIAWWQAATESVLVSLALLVASIVTLPHALLVTLGMDTVRWRSTIIQRKRQTSLRY
ncbi:Brp/Blh family beta-carotene 15,15'-dioxygenase [Hymenobacter sp. BT188]|uniref:Brp/Blh family beta-carotene 15,15'-dioxygenase n=1 Tax=Hymenobacter sp. BT188 TaxID=2763504 RepID=UPI001650DA8A|nr:Brp/Blh family beta-carotene 15,15'-dioxygenase [Hymenobacter sp. BT188]MBC6605943.1 Brp/Blh family beta-carotene 15,15'-dioxygenase [Hymenobacter sp. BT188]